MRRMMMIAALVAAAPAIVAFSVPVRQVPKTTTALRRMQVNARTITTLPSGKKYIVDLTRHGVIYEFDPKAGQIDFSRVMVRTAQGEVTIGSFLETRVLKEKLAGFKYTSQSFSLGTQATGTSQRSPTPTPSALNNSPNIECGRFTCICKGGDACLELALGSGLCSREFFCWYSNGETVCSCIRK